MLAPIVRITATTTWLYAVALFSAIVLIEPSPMEIAAILLSVLILCRYGLGKFPRSLLISITAFIYLNYFSILFSHQTDVAFASSLIRSYLYLFLVVLASFLAICSKTTIATFLKFVIIGALLNAMVIIAAYITNHELLDFAYRDAHKLRFKGFFKDPNVLGVHLILALSLIVIFDWPIKLKIFASSIILFSTYLTYSRASWAGVLVVPALFYTFLFLHNKYIKTRMLKYFFLGIIAVTVVSTLFLFVSNNSITKHLEYGHSRLSFQSYDNDRFYNQLKTIDAIVQKPFGHGAGSTVHSKGGILDYNDPHNVYLKIAAETGLPSLLIYLYIIVYLAVISFSLGKAGHILGYLLLANHLYFILLGFIIDTIHWRVIILVWALIVGLHIKERMFKNESLVATTN